MITILVNVGDFYVGILVTPAFSDFGSKVFVNDTFTYTFFTTRVSGHKPRTALVGKTIVNENCMWAHKMHKLAAKRNTFVGICFKEPLALGDICHSFLKQRIQKVYAGKCCFQNFSVCRIVFISFRGKLFDFFEKLFIVRIF